MTKTQTSHTSHTHEFLPSGCRNQWAADHDHGHCWAAFLKHHKAPQGLSISEFYDWLG